VLTINSPAVSKVVKSHFHVANSNMWQQGIGQEALDNAFRQCHEASRDMKVGDVVALDSGLLYRCEASGWTDMGKQWAARIWQGKGRFLEQ
jgi:hypothetical protein